MFDKLKELLALLNPKSDSTKGELSKEDLIKLLRNSGIAGAIAAILYFGAGLDKYDTGAFAAIAVWGLPLIVDYLKKLYTDNTKTN